jgi:hypothetical protein
MTGRKMELRRLGVRTGRKMEVPETTRMKGQADREGVAETMMK